MAHAGRRSLIDEDGLRIGESKRNPESVVGAIFERLAYTENLTDFGRRTAHHIEIYSCCGIGPEHFRHPFNHPIHGQFNKIMNVHIACRYGPNCFLNGDIERGALDLHQLIRNQFEMCGVPGDNIQHDNINTTTERECFFSRRGGDATGHNNILVIRCA